MSDETAAVIDKMLRPDPAARQGSYNELIAELSAARAAAVAREEELRARWSGPVRALVALGALALLGAAGYGAFVGLHHLPDWRSHFRLPNDKLTGSESVPAAPAVDLATQIPPAMRELQAGHYRAVEALFREIAAAAPAAQPWRISAGRSSFGRREILRRPQARCGNSRRCTRRRNFPG